MINNNKVVFQIIIKHEFEEIFIESKFIRWLRNKSMEKMRLSQEKKNVRMAQKQRKYSISEVLVVSWDFTGYRTILSVIVWESYSSGMLVLTDLYRLYYQMVWVEIEMQKRKNSYHTKIRLPWRCNDANYMVYLHSIWFNLCLRLGMR